MWIVKDKTNSGVAVSLPDALDAYNACREESEAFGIFSKGKLEIINTQGKKL